MKLWSGRFQADLDNLAERFNDSLPFDAVMYAQDIRGSIAHATMLGECGVIAERDAQTITSALESVRSDIADGKLAVTGAEDIHSFVENELVRRIGDVGKKLHTARSRNDQVATDLRLYLRDGIDKTTELLSSLITLLAAKAEQYIDAPMPAYTHMQKAQPTCRRADKAAVRNNGNEHFGIFVEGSALCSGAKHGLSGCLLANA